METPAANTPNFDSQKLSNDVLEDIGHSAERYRKIAVPPILVVDDEPVVLALLGEQLKSIGRSHVVASSPEIACNHLENSETPFSCVISDFSMTGMNGLELLKQAKSLQPDAHRILISGLADLEMAVNAINSGILFRFMLKPTRIDELTRIVKDAEEAYIRKIKERIINDDVRRLAVSLKEANVRLEKNIQQVIDLSREVTRIFSPFLHEINEVTCELVDKFCKFKRFSPDQERILRLSAQFHNLGLLRIPRPMIKKLFFRPAELTSEERSWICQHPERGGEMISFVGDIHEVSKIVRTHRERWDGSGYPDGLSAHLIPPLAQYVALASFFAENRFYGRQVVDSVLREEGKAFGPEVIEVFKRVDAANELPAKIRESEPMDCTSGMVLARDVFDVTGMRILSAGRVLNTSDLRYLRERADEGSLAHSLAVKVPTGPAVPERK